MNQIIIQAVCLEKPWMMGWIMGLKKTCQDVLMFCSKD
jgi:hypothetical protein